MAYNKICNGVKKQIKVIEVAEDFFSKQNKILAWIIDIFKNIVLN